MNLASLAIVAILSVVMFAIFLATGQQLNLTITAVVFTGGIGTLAVFFYGREEAREQAEQDASPDEPPLDTAAIEQSVAPQASTQPEETQTIDGD